MNWNGGRIGLGIVLWLLAGSALAGDFYKCIGPDKQISIQSDPCDKGWTQAWKRDATAEMPPSAEQQQALQERRQRESADSEHLSKMAGTARLERDPPPNEASAERPAKPARPELPKHACRDAHQFADALREKEFLELSNYQLSRLSEWVAVQCRDPE